MTNSVELVEKVKNALVTAGSTFTEDKKEAYISAIKNETDEKAKFILQTILDNSIVAQKNRSPLCDDTGIPHLVLEMGPNSVVTAEMLADIKEGVRQGLRILPGRPMGLMGNDMCRLDQSGGISENSEDVLPAPILIKETETDGVRLNIMMFGGGPAIRAKTYRVFHRHDVKVIIDEIIKWAIEAVAELGCSPCTLAVGVGRSHYEATSMMMEALVEGNYGVQSDMEKEITERVNESNIGPLGLHGKTSVLATFMKVGPQRASGVRIVCIRPCCCFEPRIKKIDL